MDFAVEHIGLSAQLPERLKSWYVTVLCAKVVFDNRQNPPAYLLRLAGGCLIEIYPASHSIPETSYNRLGGWRHLALRVDSIMEAKVWLEGHGVSFQEPVKPAGGGGSVLFFRDLEGHLIHLVQRPAEFVT
jgi:glyoxylase I family protein